MVGKIAKCFMGIQDDGEDAYMRDTIPISIWKQVQKQDSQATEWETIIRVGMAMLYNCSLIWWTRSEQ